MTIYTKPITDTPNDSVIPSDLAAECVARSLPVILVVQTVYGDVDIHTSAELDASQQAALDAAVAAHVGQY